MKKSIIFILCLMPFIQKAQTTVTDTVSTGPNYVNQIWYSLADDVISSQAKDNWDLAFELTGFNSSVLVNTQKTGVHVYLSPFTWTNWSSFDSTGYSSWTELHNSDTTWEIGALNRPGTYDTEDMGWGTYDMGSHGVSGTRLYLLNLPGNKFYQLGIKSLIAGTYTVTYKTLDNSDSTTFTVKKSDYNNKHFAYYSIETKTVLDREADNTVWDFTFTKYIYNNYPAGPGMFLDYPVTGMLHNKSVLVAEVRNTDVVNNVDYQNQNYSKRINEVGSDWKTFNNSTFKFEITDSLLYFVQDVNGDFWKLVMTGFGGSGNGNYILNKQKLTNSSVLSFENQNKLIVYPNPAASNSNLYIVCNFEVKSDVTVVITDINGKVVYEALVNQVDGFQAIEIPANLTHGVYNININDGASSVNKLVVVE